MEPLRLARLEYGASIAAGAIASWRAAEYSRGVAEALLDVMEEAAAAVRCEVPADLIHAVLGGASDA